MGDYNETAIFPTVFAFENVTIENTTLEYHNTSANSSANVTDITKPYRGKIGFGALENYNELWAAYYINVYYLKVVAGIGIPANVFSIVIICLMRPLTSFSVYVAALALADTLALVSKVLYMELTRDTARLGLWGCRFVRFATSFLPMCANWFLVVMTIERFAAIWTPMKVHRYFTKKSAVVCLLICLVFMLSFNNLLLWMVTETFDTMNRYDCNILEEYKYFIGEIWYWVDGAVGSAIPCVIILFCNGMIIVRIKRMAKRRRTMSMTTTTADKEKNQTQLNVMLIIVSISFVVLTTPYVIFGILVSDLDFRSPTRHTAWNWLIKQLVFFLYDSSHAINFFMYFVSGRKFRAKCFEIICCKKPKARVSTYIASSGVR